MTVQQKKTLLGLVTPLLVTFLLWIVAKEWDSKLDANVFSRHEQESQYAHEKSAKADSLQYELLLEMYCETHPTARKCQ